MRVLILHGLEGSGPDHWQTWLADELRGRGEEVAYPVLPEADDPTKEAWIAALERERREGDVVICHSLGCVLWLHHRCWLAAPAAERVLLVAPPCPGADEPRITSFFPVPRGRYVSRDGVRLVCSDNDPYCPTGAERYYGARLGCPVDMLPGRGHINPDAGFGPWPELLDWVYGAKNGVET